MRRVLLLPVLALALCRVAAPVWAQDSLPPVVLATLARLGLPEDAVAAAALPLGHRSPAWEYRARVPMQPGSAMKLVTSIVALDRLGPNLRGFTELRSAGVLRGPSLIGDLVLRGGADPELGVAALWALLADLRAQGLRHIAGDLVLDRSLFRPARTDQNLPPFDDTPEFPYNVIPDALNLAGALLPLKISADAQGVRAVTVPALPDLVLDLRLQPLDKPCVDWDELWQPAQVQREGGQIRLTLNGGFPRDCTRDVALQLIDRDELAERLFRTLWQSLGGTWAGHLRAGSAAASSAQTVLLARREARPWGEVLRHQNKTSDNAEARLLYLQLGVPDMAAQPQASTAALAAAAVHAWFVQQGIDDRGLVLDNGSGLSRSERISAWQMVQMLRVAHGGRHAADLMATLPTAGVDGTMRRRLKDSPAAGWARLKTGTLRNVVALAGYVNDERGRPWAVAVMVNHEQAEKARPVLDAFIDDLARHGPYRLVPPSFMDRFKAVDSV